MCTFIMCMCEQHGPRALVDVGGKSDGGFTYHCGMQAAASPLVSCAFMVVTIGKTQLYGGVIHHKNLWLHLALKPGDPTESVGSGVGSLAPSP